MAPVVIAPAVQVTVGGRVLFLEKGAVLPDGIEEDTLARFREEELVADMATPEIEMDEGVYKDVSVKDLKADLAKRNEGREGDAKIVPADPGNRPQIVAALIADDAKQ